MKGQGQIMSTEKPTYGVEDSSYQAAGGLTGLTNLVDAFYDYMDSLPEARTIREMHQADLTETRRKLTYFLAGWLGGPRLYPQHYGSIHIPMAHQHLAIGRDETEAWLLCMSKAVEDQPYDESFKVYLMTQFRVPAERILSVCQ
jgi:hemoglobin